MLRLVERERKEFELRAAVAKALADYREHASQRARPELEHQASHLLKQVTGSIYPIIRLTPSYLLEVADSGRFHPLKRFSGGEQDLTALCLRLALSLTLARQRGAEQGFVILDEVFGSQDAERRRLVLQQLGELAENSDFQQIFVISHTDDIREHCRLHVKVKRENGISVADGPDGRRLRSQPRQWRRSRHVVLRIANSRAVKADLAAARRTRCPSTPGVLARCPDRNTTACAWRGPRRSAGLPAALEFGEAQLVELDCDAASGRVEEFDQLVGVVVGAFPSALDGIELLVCMLCSVDRRRTAYWAEHQMCRDRRRPGVSDIGGDQLGRHARLGESGCEREHGAAAGPVIGAVGLTRTIVDRDGEGEISAHVRHGLLTVARPTAATCWL